VLQSHCDEPLSPAAAAVVVAVVSSIVVSSSSSRVSSKSGHKGGAHKGGFALQDCTVLSYRFVYIHSHKGGEGSLRAGKQWRESSRVVRAQHIRAV
jgi:hypothetical protein